MSPFCGATDTPLLDFWWCLLWVSKPEWAALFMLGGHVHVTCLLRFTSGATPADLMVASMAAKPSLPHSCKALVGLQTGSFHAAAQSVRSGRRSTNSAIPAWWNKVRNGYFWYCISNANSHSHRTKVKIKAKILFDVWHFFFFLLHIHFCSVWMGF